MRGNEENWKTYMKKSAARNRNFPAADFLGKNLCCYVSGFPLNTGNTLNSP